jgi:Xaa-Pro aminopeptidase
MYVILDAPTTKSLSITNISTWFTKFDKLSVYRERRRKLLEASGGKEVVAGLPPNIFYVSDFFGSGFAIIKDDKTILVTTRLEQFRAERYARETEVVLVENWKDSWKEVRRLLGDHAISDTIEGLEKIKNVKENKELFMNVRRKKDNVEIIRIKNASKIIDSVFSRLEREIRPGRTEFELASYAMEEALKKGGTTNGFDAALSPLIVASGENSSYPHAELTERKVRRKDVVLCDISLRYMGYNSDATRTFCVGDVDTNFTKQYNVVKNSQEAGLNLCMKGKSCSEVSIKSREVLKDAGLESYLTHGIGHGVGIEIHEMPSISNKSKEILQEGDVVTVEPGIYFPNKYGIRIEDTILVGEIPLAFHTYTKELIVL